MSPNAFKEKTGNDKFQVILDVMNRSCYEKILEYINARINKKSQPIELIMNLLQKSNDAA